MIDLYKPSYHIYSFLIIHSSTCLSITVPRSGAFQGITNIKIMCDMFINQYSSPESDSASDINPLILSDKSYKLECSVDMSYHTLGTFYL